MAYEIETWERDGAHGEARLDVWRVVNLDDARKIYSTLPLTGVARVTLARTGSALIWDLHRAENRDTELDADMRTLARLPANTRQAHKRRQKTTPDVIAAHKSE